MFALEEGVEAPSQVRPVENSPPKVIAAGYDWPATDAGRPDLSRMAQVAREADRSRERREDLGRIAQGREKVDRRHHDHLISLVEGRGA